MIDQPFGDASRVLRAPDIRLGSVDTTLFRGSLPFERAIERPDRSLLVYARRGDFELCLAGSERPPIACPEGTVAGFEGGRAHSWRATKAGGNGQVELLMGSIPRRQGVLQRLTDGTVIVPRDAEPYAHKLRLALELHLLEFETAENKDEEGVIRRCAEICLIELVRYARSMIAQQPNLPAGLEHDEALLRAWAAYFDDPQRRWTLRALAEAAGLGRTAFTERFSKIFGAPPLQTLTRIRLEHAEVMLRDSAAPLIEIAFIAGYNSEAAFVRAFHRQYGIPPGRFRETQHEARS